MVELILQLLPPLVPTSLHVVEEEFSEGVDVALADLLDAGLDVAVRDLELVSPEPLLLVADGARNDVEVHETFGILVGIKGRVLISRRSKRS